MGEAAVEIELVAEDIPRAESSGFVDPVQPSTPRPSRAWAVPKCEWAKVGIQLDRLARRRQLLRRLKIRPPSETMRGSMTSLWSAISRALVPTLSASIMPEYPTTSAARLAASLLGARWLSVKGSRIVGARNPTRVAMSPRSSAVTTVEGGLSADDDDYGQSPSVVMPRPHRTCSSMLLSENPPEMGWPNM